MEKETEGWGAIAALIDADKANALEWFHRGGFVFVAMGADGRGTLRRQRRARLVVLQAAAACLFLTVGLASLWLTHGVWRTSPVLSAREGIFADSSLYSEAGRLDAEGPAAGIEIEGSPFFTAWAETALATQVGGTNSEEQKVASLWGVEHGDPEKLRRAIGRAIRENTFKRILIQMQELYAQEA